MKQIPFFNYPALFAKEEKDLISANITSDIDIDHIIEDVYNLELNYNNQI